MSRPRTFDFHRTIALWEALPVIQAALDDEGLTLNDADNGSHSRITSVLVDGVKRVIIPASRISPKRHEVMDDPVTA